MTKRKLWMCADIELMMEPDETQRQAEDRMCVTLSKAGVNLAAWEAAQVITFEAPDEPVQPVEKTTLLKTLLRLLKGGR